MDLNNIEKTKEALKNALEKSPHPFLFEGVIRKMQILRYIIGRLLS